MKNVEAVLSDISKSLGRPNNAAKLALKLCAAELILRLKLQQKKRFGLFVILGWQDVWSEYANIPDNSQDIFTHFRLNITQDRLQNPGQRNIVDTLNFDGAILIDAAGNVLHSGVIIEGLRPKVVAEKLNPGRFDDLSEQFGFSEKVHSRHLAAITSSYLFNDTIVFTVSEETGTFHIFKGGRIIYARRESARIGP